ncbi:MAG: hypothetical protein PQJ60_03190 [Spirochaetales bacterium]|nr:hypothetical protein [Spirochaetales bacterium]
MKRKIIIGTASLLILLLLTTLRFSAGLWSRRPLFPGYEADRIVSLQCPGEGWTLIKEDGRWMLDRGDSLLPLREDRIEELLRLPAEADHHRVGTLEGEAQNTWLPSQSTVLIYTGESGEVREITVYYQRNGKDEEDRLFLRKGSEPKIYLSPLGTGELLQEHSLLYTGLFPPSLSAENITYYRLFNSREGGESALYRYELIAEEGNWTYRGELPASPLKIESIHLLLLRLAGLEGDLILPSLSFPSENLRFQVEVHDNRGQRFLLNVGERIEQDGAEYFLVNREGEELVYGVSRERLSGIAPSLNTLFQF